MGKGTIKTKAMTMAVAMSMVAGLCPSTAFAANSSDVAKIQDGTHTGTARCTPNGRNQFDEYDLSLKVTIKNGKIESINEVKGNGDADNDDYISDAVNGYDNYTGVVKQIVDANGTEGINAVSGATCSSNAIVDAVNNALEEATKKAETTVKTDDLQAAITKADGLTEADYTADSWNSMQAKLTAAKAALTAKDQTTVDTATKELTDAIDALESKTPDAQKEVYVLMNIPYADFYKAEGVTGADTVSSATKQKTRASLAAGSYHVNSDGSDITGVTFPVKISDASVLEKYTQITDESKVDITTSIKGKVSTTTYNGKDALFESASYSYYTLSDTPSYYKEATVNADGSLSFSKVKGAEPTTLTNAKTEFSTSSKYGDYQLDITSDVLDKTNTVYGVVISTNENNYGLRHVENIWRKTELAWSTGFVTESHGNTLDSKDYAAMMGQTIEKVTYYTDKGIYEIPMDQKVAKKFSGSVSVGDTSVNAKSAAITVSGIPEDFEEEYEIEGMDKDAYTVDITKTEKGTTRTITFNKTPEKGRYTLTLNDKSGVYAPISTTFNLYTEAIPAKYNKDGKEPALEKTEDANADEYQTYLKNIQSVTVNGKTYAASGRGAVKLIREDGKLDLSQNAFKDAKAGDAYTVTVTEDGYKEYTFTYKVPDENGEYSYVYVGMSWSEYWKNEDVYNAGSAESSDVKDSRNEYDKGAFDTVTRATANHGLHRGSFQCTTLVYDTEGNAHSLVSWTADGKGAVFSDGKTYTKTTDDSTKITTFTATDGTSFTFKDYNIIGWKYVPVKVKTTDLEAFKKKYTVVENGGTLAGGYSEGELLKAYEGLVANVTENTNGLKTATKNEDGSFSFSAKQEGTESGIKDQELKTAGTAEEMGLKVQPAGGNFGEFLRVDLKKNYGDLGSNMQAVTWKYYGTDSTYGTALATYGTKFAADNWMHKSNGIQLGLTHSVRCQLPEGTDGTGYWTVTISALGYKDVTYKFEATEENIVKDAGQEEVDTAALEAAIAKAEGLKESDYTADSWANMQAELGDARTALQEKVTQSAVDEATADLTAAIDALVKVEQPTEVNTSKLEAAITEADTLKEADYTAESWSVYQAALQSARVALEAKESQEAVDNALATLSAAKEALVKADEQPVTVDTSSLEKAIADAKALKEADYTADSWKALQSALSEAQKVLEAKESQEAVDSATNSLNKAIKALVKKDSASVKKTDGTTNGSKTSGSDSVKTGDPASVLGWLGLAVSSLGAGMGGFAWKRKKRK